MKKNEDITTSDISDLLQTYLEKINRFPLLTKEGEIELAKKIKEGDKESRTKSRDEFIKANLRFVVSVANKYVKRNGNLDLMDLIQEGNDGLMRAVDGFDYRRGFKFSTYAIKAIKRAINKFLNEQSRIIRIPDYMIKIIYEYNQIKNQLSQDLEREPSPEEIAAEMGISVKRARYIIEISQNTISLETPIGNENDSLTLNDSIEDEKGLELVQSVVPRLSANQIIKNLQPREQEVLIMRFGLDGANKCTLQKIGNEFELTRECIRQIEFKALKKIRQKVKQENKQ